MAKTAINFKKISSFVASPMFFWGVVSLLVLQALWISFSSLYPMAFDEEFHLGIIKLYAHHLSPFWSAPPEGASALGAVSRDPSFLFHYLMSFPYRLISVFTDSQYITVMFLRMINVALFVSGLVISKRMLLKTGASRSLINFCLLLLVLIPVVPLLVAQINYDNLIFPLTSLALLLSLNFDKILRQKKTVDSRALILLIICCTSASLVKYAFLPIYLAIMGFVAVRLLQYRRQLKFKDFVSSWRRVSLIAQIALIVGLTTVGSIGVERYGVNLWRYHTPVADCRNVLSVDECLDYGPWARDYNLARSKPAKIPGVTVYAHEWFRGMWRRSFFALAGPTRGYQTSLPMPVPGITGIVLAVSGALAILFGYAKVLKTQIASTIWLLMSVSLTYIGILWLDGLEAFTRTGKAVAINGRYLLPVALPLMVLAGLSANQLLRRYPKIKVGLAVLAVACLLYGGGALTYILRSNDSWYWPSAPLKSFNHLVQRDLGHYIIGYKN